MKKWYFILCIGILIMSCVPKVYRVYDKYEHEKEFHRSKISGEILGLTTLFMGDENMEIKNLLNSIKDIEVVTYSGMKTSAFDKDVRASFRGLGYKEVLQSKGNNSDLQFFVKKGIRKVRAFYAIGKDEDAVSVYAIRGTFHYTDLERAFAKLKGNPKARKLYKEILSR